MFLAAAGDVQSPTSARIHGLDTLRALAVSLVVLHHYTLFVGDASTCGWVGRIGWTGVDLFFALSGYLIGNQIFAAAGSARGLALGRFYVRRLLRTLPNFWVVLALYASWPAWRGDPPMLPRGTTSLSPRTSTSSRGRRSRTRGRCASRSSSTCCCRPSSWPARRWDGAA